MPAPWEKYQQPAQSGPWMKYAQPQSPQEPPQEAAPAYSGSILPFSRDAEGNTSFDSNAGLLGTLKRALTLPGDAYTGKVDPMSDEGIGRAMEMAAVVSPMTPAARTGPMIPGATRKMVKAKVDAPTPQQLRAAAKTGYDDVSKMGVEYSAAAVKQFADDMERQLSADGIIPETAATTYAILKKLQNPPAGSTAPISGVEAARRAFGKVGGKFSDPTDQMAANRVVEGLSDWVARPDSVRVLSGPAGRAAKTLESARGNYAAYKRATGLADIGNASELRAAAANSGKNIGNTIRSQLAGVTLSPKKGRGFSQAEIDAIESIVKGSRTNNALRSAGNVLGGGGGLGQLSAAGLSGAAGAAMGGPVGAAIGATVPVIAGKGAKTVANSMTKRALANIGEQTAKRSPLYTELMKNAPMLPKGNAGQKAILRALLMLQEEEAARQSQMATGQ